MNFEQHIENLRQELDAKKHPKRHQNLLVRVCGYSAAFVHLNEDTQNEIIRRAIR